MNIKSAKFIISNQNAKDCPKSDLPEYAFIGRSNVGKSSLINMLTNNKKLAKTYAKLCKAFPSCTVTSPATLSSNFVSLSVCSG